MEQTPKLRTECVRVYSMHVVNGTYITERMHLTSNMLNWIFNEITALISPHTKSCIHLHGCIHLQICTNEHIPSYITRKSNFTLIRLPNQFILNIKTLRIRRSWSLSDEIH